MKTKMCKVCNIEKDILLFPKWKRTCRSCGVENNKKWKEKNKKIIKSNCIDCKNEYETIIYSTQVPNVRCRKCSINSNKKIITEKKCRICESVKNVTEYYKNYKMCKSCLFQKRNKRYNERLKEDINFRIRHNMKVNFKRHISSIGSNKDDKMINILGCSYKYFVEYIESKFENWMNWDNYGLYNGKLNHGWDLDHIIPISSGNNKEQIKKLYHYTNFQPLCSKINRDIKKDIYNYEN